MKTLAKYKNHESNLVRHAYRELELIGGLEAESQQQMATHILDIVERFSEEGHSGFSAGYALSILKRVMAFEPVTPLTGEPDEWAEVMDGCFQNKRFSEVFKDGADAQAYWSQGRIFSDDGGKTWFVNRDSRVPVTFPWSMPERERVILEKKEQ